MSKKVKHHPNIQIEVDQSFETFLARHHIKPLDQDKKFIAKSQPTKKKVQENIQQRHEPLPFITDDQLAPVMSEEIISFARPDLSYKIIRRLRSGKIPIEATLDLHGLTANKAERELSQFLARCELGDLRCVLIVHGKGRLSEKPVLKNKLNNWLRHLPQILAFCSAKPTHGGQGAIYVLLRKKRQT